MSIHLSNKKAWNEAAESYKNELHEDIQFLLKGGISLCKPELKFLEGLGDWCDTAVHLQCAAGTDSLSLINYGAKRVIGVDISDEMIRLAREKSHILEMDAQWVNADILHLPENLNGVADLVYTGQGAINWIMDIQAWAKVVYKTLKNGGKFYMSEGHPIAFMFDMPASTLQFDEEFDGYFAKKLYSSQGLTEDYIGNLSKAEAEHAVKYERAWPVSEVIMALINAGLTLKVFEEHPDEYWKEFPNLSIDEREKFPNTFSLLMVK